MTDTTLDAATLEIMRNQLESIAEEMGNVLITSAYSPNIKERQDCSTALFDVNGRLIAQAEHIPVHLGAMPEAVETVIECDPQPGDVFALNDPFEGGTHLPDVTLVSPVFIDGEPLGYAVSRAHHADVGGMTPGSMPAGAREIYQEGVRLPPVRLITEGSVNNDVLDLFMANVRNSHERHADIRAQIAANERANTRLREFVTNHGKDRTITAFDAVIDYSRDRITAELTDLPDGTYHARDVLEGDGVSDDEIPIEVAVTIDGTAVDFDFEGTASQIPGNVNAPIAVAKSAVYFVLRCVTDPGIPPNHGCYAPVTVSIPSGSLLDPQPPAAVVGGNVETSQRVTDVVFAAFANAVPERVPAQGQGTMNNLTIGSREAGNASFTYYETIAGGFGARSTDDGMDGVQVGMTNTLNTPIESLEAEYPLFIERYSFRENSGGRGQYRGGLGLVRSITVEETATVSLLTERRRVAPSGIDGGKDGMTGENRINGDNAPTKTTRDVAAGTTITICTPGGGGHGEPNDRDPDAIEDDQRDEKQRWE